MKYDVTIFGIDLTLNPIAFSIPIGSKSWDIYWYGIIIASGFLLALIYGFKNARRFGIDTDRMLDVVLVTTPVAILCARAYYVIFDGEPLESIGDFFGFGDSSGFAGLAIYGGVIGAFACGALMCKLRKVNILDIFDMASIAFLIGQGIGRWGNFINQEAYGDFTGSSWWGMQSTRTVNEMGEGMVHPCFLYESVWCLLGVAVLHMLSKRRAFKGEIVLFYGMWYGLGRAVIELLRTDSLMLGGLKVSCLLSVLLCLACAAVWAYFKAKSKESRHDGEYSSVFAPQLEEDSAEEDAVTEENTIISENEDAQDN